MPNVYIIGQTGVGKSALINAVFNQDIAETGIGEPITNNITKYEINECGTKWNFYDTKGISNENWEDIYYDIYNRIKKNKNPSINCDIVWVCINEGSGRIEESENNIIIKFIRHSIPIIIVLTKAYNDEGLKNNIKKNFSTINVIRVNSRPYEIEDGTIIRPFNVDKLFSKTKEILIELQKIDKNDKNNTLKKEVIENKTMDDLPKMTNSEDNNEPLKLIRIKTMEIAEKNAIAIGMLYASSKKVYEEIEGQIEIETLLCILNKFHIDLNKNLIKYIILNVKNSIKVKKIDKDLFLRLIPSLLTSNHIISFNFEKANYIYRLGQTLINVIYKLLIENNNNIDDLNLAEYIITTINREEKIYQY